MSRHTTTNAEWRGLLDRLKRVVAVKEDAEDLLQSAFLRLETYRRDAEVNAPNAFVFRTAVNLGIDERRKLSRRMEVGGLDDSALEVRDQAPLADEALAAKHKLNRMTSVLQELPPRTLEIFLLRRVDEMRYREIAAKLGITVSAVEKHLARAASHIARSSELIDD